MCSDTQLASQGMLSSTKRRNDPLADPATAVVCREHIELAFMAAVPHAAGGAGLSAAETADILDTTTASVNNAPQRARATLDARPLCGDAAPTSLAEQADLVARYVQAWHAHDVSSLVALRREDASMAMSPAPSWYQVAITYHPQSAIEHQRGPAQPLRAPTSIRDGSALTR
jgi:hypothetical protein